MKTVILNIFGGLLSDFKWFRNFIGGEWIKVCMLNEDFGEFWLKKDSVLFDENSMKILLIKEF